MSTILNFEPSKLSFAAPHTVRGGHLTFQFQSLSYDGQPCLIQTKPFIGNGLSFSKFQDQQQMVIPASSIPSLLKIDEEAKNALLFPEDAPSSWKESFENGEAYKAINNDKMYIKTKDLLIFDKDGELYEEEVKNGTYSAILHVVGIYIGSHGSTGKHASLQVKVKQLQYEPLSNKCLFRSPTELVKAPKATSVANLSFKQPLSKRRKVNRIEPLTLNTNVFDDVDKNFITHCDDSDFLWKFYLHCQALITKGQSPEDEMKVHKLVRSTEKQLKSLLGDDWLLECRNK